MPAGVTRRDDGKGDHRVGDRGGSANWGMGSIQAVVRDLVRSNRFPLVLDNVWCEDSAEFQTLVASLMYGHPQSAILVISRPCKVGDAAGACFTFYQFFLKGHIFRNEILVDMWVAEGFISL